ncbi:MAG: barstar family protein [Propionibacteriaceae bacterium]|nr:barstar family protein [Micropruina sp.]HBX82569.1 hypothetical protein [Propionibacteriaceae bacterium]HBY24555.1 hypothetical protein [Propionibacteriaceae bacterium]
MISREWTCIADAVAGTEGVGIVFAASEDRAAVDAGLRTAGYTDIAIDGSKATDFRDVQALIADAFAFPPSAASNLDALADCLRGLSARPEPRLALLWDGADVLIRRDLPGWYRLTDVLSQATDDLWRGDLPDDRLFETVLFLDSLNERADA